ncbi:MAG: hypothetical protein IKC56_00400 [Clostridia bacterium]|nr:hypothetical protein [Clostridia bacterium]
MVITSLHFQNKVWACKNQGATLSIRALEGGEYALSYEKKGKALTCNVQGEKAKRLASKLRALHLQTWESDYFAPVLDGEDWELTATFACGSQKTVRGMNGYPQNWQDFLVLYFWVAQACEETQNTDCGQTVSAHDYDDFDMWELEKKFTLLDRKTLAQIMNMNLRRE